MMSPRHWPARVKRSPRTMPRALAMTRPNANSATAVELVSPGCVTARRRLRAAVQHGSRQVFKSNELLHPCVHRLLTARAPWAIRERTMGVSRAGRFTLDSAFHPLIRGTVGQGDELQ